MIKFSVTGNRQSNFNLLAHIYERHKSRSSPQKNYIRNENVILNFDSVRDIFYRSNQSIAQSFTINDPKTQQSNEQQISGSLPTVALGGSYYYYIKREWYKRGDNKSLFKEYFK